MLHLLDYHRLLVCLLMALVTMGWTTVEASSSARETSTGSASSVRSTDDRIIRLLQLGCEHSSTFRDLVHQLADSDVIVYIRPNLLLPSRQGARLQFACACPDQGVRYVHIDLNTRLVHDRWALVAVIAHELHHALEIAASADVIDARSLRGLYQRIGFRGGYGYETQAARRVADVVAKELPD